jgi:hypothetical protein
MENGKMMYSLQNIYLLLIFFYFSALKKIVYLTKKLILVLYDNISITYWIIF